MDSTLFCEDIFMRNFVKRLFLYIPGLLCVCAGIVFCKKCSMGISPISSVPYVLSLSLPLSFGQFTMCFHFVNIAGQMLLQKRIGLKTSLQILLALAFSFIIDLMDSLLYVNNEFLFFRILALIASILLTAIGMVLMIKADLVQNPVDGFVKQVSDLSGKSLGQVKIIYDASCVFLSLLLSILLLHRLEGFGIATVASAFFVGKCVNWIRRIPAFLAVMHHPKERIERIQP